MDRRRIVSRRRLLAVGILSFGLSGCQGVAQQSSAGTTSGATSAAPATSIPSTTAAPDTSKPLGASVQFQWVREPTTIPGLTPASNAASLKVGPRSIGFFGNVRANANPARILDSTAGMDAAGRVRVTLRADGVGCHGGDEGSYELTPSASGLSMAARAIEDVCAARKAAFEGAWTRADCPSAPQWCLGAMDAGEHVSINYLPFVKAPEWDFDYGRFAFTVPAGWVTQEDNADGYVLMEHDGADGAGIFVFSDVLAHAQKAECAAAPQAGVGTSAGAIFAWISSLAGLEITNVDRHARIGGLDGYRMDVAIDPHTAGTCPWTGGEPTVQLFVNAQFSAEEAFDWGLCCDGHMRLYILEEAPGRALVVDIEALDTPTWKALLPKAMPIVESFEFRH